MFELSRKFLQFFKKIFGEYFGKHFLTFLWGVYNIEVCRIVKVVQQSGNSWEYIRQIRRITSGYDQFMYDSQK